MSFDFFDKLKNAKKEDEGVQDWFNGVTSLFSKKDKENFSRKEISLLDEIQMNSKVTTTYRDKMLVERSLILNRYASETSNKGTMFFIYSKHSSDDNMYNLCICDDRVNTNSILVDTNQLPENAGVDSVLRSKNDKFVFDEESTKDIYDELNKMTQRLLEEQASELNNKRVDENLYEVVEVSGDTVWLMNTTKNDGDCFEEIIIPSDVLTELNAGDTIQYLNGEYKIFNN